MANNKLYRDVEKVDARYWRDLQVRYDALYDTVDKGAQFKVAFATFGTKDLAELANIFKLPTTEGNKEQLMQSLSQISAEQKMLICLLKDFTHRRKTTITNYYDMKIDEKVYETPIAQLYMLYMESPAHLYEIYTFHIWKVRGSGSLFSSESKQKKITEGKALKIAEEKPFQDKLCDTLFKKSGEKNKYRVFSYTKFNDRIALLIYKRVNDTSIPDFDQNVRNQEVDMLLYQINWSEQTVELKATNVAESGAIKEHTELTFNTSLTPLKPDIFREYNPTVFKDAVLKGITASGKPVEDFLIDRITFRGSPLKNSPEISIYLKNMEVWPSVIDAHEKGAINVKSIKDVAYVSVHTAKTSRNIRSIIKDNGNVIFSMDDSRMDAAAKDKINTKFQERFGVPLFQEITNEKFEAGKADLIDYVMGQSSPEAIREAEEETVMLQLQEEILLSIDRGFLVECMNDECDFKERFEHAEGIHETCPSCNETELKTKSLSTFKIHMENVISAVKNQLEHLCVGEEWVLLKESTRKYNSHQYNFQNYERKSDGKILQLLVTDQVIPNRVVQHLIKQMTPIFVVFVGKQEKYVSVYNQECIQSMTFGEVYSVAAGEAKNHFNKLYADIELRAKNYMASAAYKAHVSAENNVGEEPSKVNQDYNDTEFEDDVYCMLKDMFSNAVKWGQEMKGKAVPEGVFSISFRKKKGNNFETYKYAYSYDCKLTRKTDGYELSKSEQRKAVEYVNTLNDSDYISSYASDNQLSAHIFISNKVKPSQVKGMVAYFSEKLGEDYNAIAVFLSLEMLNYMHTLYRQNYETLMQSPNTFHSQLKGLFSNPGVISTEEIDKVFEKALDPALREQENIEMRKLTKDIL
ncbi:hypothetical protein [Paenibacillus alginolyticus]|uniref:Uncharacterized protein n=1 Tax=Paenibacillus alginolyticus TaxID=59839 RepID=A0ABT4GJQ9_9BACL|nr:hypothetical protein [Paenibacillus alginolyticus]MCY9696439.1 hypothetical protein [Paenibacillus alginolyticus]MEC0145278.1 hypothetical protein [Paenibacillus alginolyticus]